MMKLALNKKLKIALFCILVSFIAATSYLLYKEIKIPVYENRTQQVYSYSNNAGADYKVYLKPNDLFKGNTLESAELYITKYINYIGTIFNYEFTGTREANITGEYNIKATVEGLTGKGEKIITIWEKEFPIVRNKRFSSTNGKIIIEEEVKLYLDEYNRFVEETIEATKIDCDTTLTLLMDIRLTGTTDIGTFEENLSPNIIVTLNTPMFEIMSNNIDKPGAIEETIQVQLPVNTKQVLLYGIIIGILALALIFLIFFVKTAPDKEPLEKELKKIFKKHGDRLVALNSDMDISNAKNVRSIDDLVRIADEIGKPILYKYSEDYNDINKFYVTNEDDIFVFDLNDLSSVEVIEIVDENSSLDINEKIKIES